MKGAPKSSLRLFLHRALYLLNSKCKIKKCLGQLVELLSIIKNCNYPYIYYL